MTIQILHNLVYESTRQKYITESRVVDDTTEIIN